MATPPQYLYFARVGDSGPIKIGLSQNPHKRIKNLQSHNHDTVEMVRLLSGDRLAEDKFHNYFAEYKIRGEWFNFSPEMLTVTLADIDIKKPMRVSQMRAWRSKMNLSQQAAAKALGLSPSRVYIFDRDVAKIPRRIELAMMAVEHGLEVKRPPLIKVVQT